jgi:hypothetical protein
MFMSAESMPSPRLIDCSIRHGSRIGVGDCNRRFFLHSGGVGVKNSYDEKLSDAELLFHAI